VSVSSEKPLEIVKKKKRATSPSCASLCREVTLERRFHSSSHILGFLYCLFKVPIGVCYSPCWWRE